MINYRSSTDQRLPGSSPPRLRTNLSAAKCRAVHTRHRKKLLFVCGGTGGHVFPAIAVAEQVAKLDRNREIDIQFMGADDRDSQPVRSRGFNWIRGPAVRIQRPYLSVRNLVSFFQLLSAIATSIIFMMRFKPDVVLGMLQLLQEHCAVDRSPSPRIHLLCRHWWLRCLTSLHCCIRMPQAPVPV